MMSPMAHHPPGTAAATKPSSADAWRWKTMKCATPSAVVRSPAVTLDYVVVSPDGGPGPYTVEEPLEHHVVVLVSGVHRATMRALAYARNLQATSVRALSVNLESDRANDMLSAWVRNIDIDAAVDACLFTVQLGGKASEFPEVPIYADIESDVVTGSLYDYPKYYDLLFGSDWKAEFDFLEGCFARCWSAGRL